MASRKRKLNDCSGDGGKSCGCDACQECYREHDDFWCGPIQVYVRGELSLSGADLHVNGVSLRQLYPAAAGKLRLEVDREGVLVDGERLGDEKLSLLGLEQLQADSGVVIVSDGFQDWSDEELPQKQPRLHDKNK